MKTINALLSILATFPVLGASSHPLLSNNYNVDVSHGPFVNNLVLTEKQKNFSTWWKENIKKELNKPVNFAGKYRLFVSKGGHGTECLHDYWICGWVIDKSSGKVVATLPTSPEGGNSYADFVDNGTSDGIGFEYFATKRNSSIIIKGRAVNAPLRDNNGNFSVPECRLIQYNFDGSSYSVIKESDNGCNLPKEKEIYGH